MTRQYWLAVAAGGIAMFIWASLAHMATPLASAGLQKMPAEPLVLADLQKDLHGDAKGLFIFPYVAPSETGTAQAKLADSPSGLLLYHPAGAKGMQPGQLIGELLLELFETAVATALLGMGSVYGFGRQVAFFAGLGALAAVVTNGSYWLWYGFPAAFSLAAMVIEFVKFLVAGLAVAAVIAWTTGQTEEAPA